MKKTISIAAVAAGLILTLVPDAADAQYGGVHRRTRRRTAVVVGSSVKAADSAEVNQAHQQEAAAEKEAAAAKAEAAAAKEEAAAAKAEADKAKAAAAAPPPPPATAPGQPLPLGTVVSTLPAGCVSTPVDGVEYYYCGGNFYRAAYEGNHLVYVTTKPK